MISLQRKVMGLFLGFSSFFFGASQAQEKTVQANTIRMRFNWESVNEMRNGENMGLMGVSGEIFQLIPKAPNFYAGFQSYAALTGQNGGFFAFGLTSGYNLPLIKNSLSLDIGGFLGGGGDGKRAEDGGLIVGGRLELEKRIGAIGLRAGVSHLRFVPSHYSTHFSLGFSSSTSFLFRPRKTINFTEPTTQISPILRRMRFYVVGKTMLLDNLKQGNGSYRDFTAGLIGVQTNYFFTPHIYGNVEIMGAFAGGIYGYMSYVFGVGAVSPYLANVVALEGGLFGGSNGGSPFTIVGGGAVVQPEIGLNFKIFNKTYIKAMTGLMWSPSGNIQHPHISLSLGSDLLPFTLKKGHTTNKNLVMKDSAKVHELGLYAFNRTYFSNTSGLTKRGIPYDDIFHLVGLGIRKYFIRQLSISGSTVWTYTGSYGGYGEGWLSATFHQNLLKKSDVLQLEVEAGGGAAGGIIDVGSGLMTKYGLGARWNINPTSSIFFLAGEMRPIRGTFKAYYLDFGGQIRLDAIFGK